MNDHFNNANLFTVRLNFIRYPFVSLAVDRSLALHPVLISLLKMTKRRHELVVGLELCSKINHIHQLKDSNMSASILWLIFHHLLAVLPDKDPSYSLPTAPQSTWWMDCHKIHINTTGNDFVQKILYCFIKPNSSTSLLLIFRKWYNRSFDPIFSKPLLKLDWCEIY